VPTPRVETRADGRGVTARYPNHLWHIDLTTVPTTAGFWTSWLPWALPPRWPFCWWLAVVLDHAAKRHAPPLDTWDSGGRDRNCRRSAGSRIARRRAHGRPTPQCGRRLSSAALEPAAVTGDGGVDKPRHRHGRCPPPRGKAGA
jgi:hypothetical protein